MCSGSGERISWGNAYHCDVTMICVSCHMCSAKQISLVICVSLQETHIPSDMCSRVWETHFTRDLCSHRETHIGEDREFLVGKMIHVIGETKKVQMLTMD